MLRACLRVLRPGGRLAFYTIYIPPGLSPSAYRRAARARSPGVTSGRRQHQELLHSAGFRDIEELDFTPEFLRITRRWGAARRRHLDELRAADGQEATDRRLRENRATVRAIEEGLLRRSLFVAERPR